MGKLGDWEPLCGNYVDVTLSSSIFLKKKCVQIYLKMKFENAI
jgi:hypothetical protein